MSPNEPLPIFRPNLYLLPTLSSISENEQRVFKQWKHKHLALCQPYLKFPNEVRLREYRSNKKLVQLPGARVENDSPRRTVCLLLSL